LRRELEIVARAYEEETVPKLYRAGANHVVSPTASGAIRMASFMIRPSIVSFLDVATRSPDFTLRLEQEAYSFVFNPVASTRLDPGDIMIVLGAPEQVRKLHTFVNS